MTLTAAEVEDALLALDPVERAAVIRRILRQLAEVEDDDVDQDEIAEAWRDELSRRIADIEDGKVQLLDFEESHAQLRAELAARRR